MKIARIEERMNINLEYYRIFYYVACNQSFTQAAQHLCISQPAVSQAIKLMEKNLGSELFVRIPKGVKLTPEGEVLFQYIKKGYETILMGETQFRKMLDLENGEIRIGASDMTLQFYLLPYLEEFHKRYPKIKVNVTNAPTPETIGFLADGAIDFGIVSTPIAYQENLEIREVRSIQDTFVASSRYEELKGEKLSYATLKQYPIICLEPKTSTRAYMDKFLQENDVVLEPEFELATSDIIVQFALRGLGIGHVVRDFAQKYLDSGELFELKFAHEMPSRQMCIITNDANPMSKAARGLLSMITEEQTIVSSMK